MDRNSIPFSYLIFNTICFSMHGHHQVLQIIKYFEEGLLLQLTILTLFYDL
jgi:hypothetical protein